MDNISYSKASKAHKRIDKIEETYVTRVNGESGDVLIDKKSVGLDKVKNEEQATKQDLETHTSDEDIHISSSERNDWNNKEDSENKGKAGGYASLDDNTKIPKTQIPEITKEDVGLDKVKNEEQATKSEFNEHVDNKTTHITSSERSEWNNKEDSSNKGESGGYASLDGNGKIPLKQLPDVSKSQTFVVKDTEERESIIGALEGDRAYETETGNSYIYYSDGWGVVAKADWENVNIDYENVVNKPSIPKKLSDLSNDEDFVNKSYVDEEVEELQQKVENARKDNTQELQIEVRDSDPTAPEIGRIWFRSDL